MSRFGRQRANRRTGWTATDDDHVVFGFDNRLLAVFGCWVKIDHLYRGSSIKVRQRHAI